MGCRPPPPPAVCRGEKRQKQKRPHNLWRSGARGAACGARRECVEGCRAGGGSAAGGRGGGGAESGLPGVRLSPGARCPAGRRPGPSSSVAPAPPGGRGRAGGPRRPHPPAAAATPARPLPWRPRRPPGARGQRAARRPEGGGRRPRTRRPPSPTYGVGALPPQEATTELGKEGDESKAGSASRRGYGRGRGLKVPRAGGGFGAAGGRDSAGGERGQGRAAAPGFFVLRHSLSVSPQGLVGSGSWDPGRTPWQEPGTQPTETFGEGRTIRSLQIRWFLSD
ncbi:collagen alpha-1(III) chain-like [Canis lupus dingo]|uniref:collagen alpha-1(III) chain-like n=1 Tax=Canis lupus dingo TaxID=286419 RepID=UPI0020C20379|nr:collagen alpha-1(III) chain-like [Canis lupus dingo]